MRHDTGPMYGAVTAMAQPDQHDGMQEAEGVKPPDKFDCDEQKRTRELSIRRHGDTIDSPHEDAIRNAPSTLRQNLLGAGADERGTTEEDRDEELRDLGYGEFLEGR